MSERCSKKGQDSGKCLCCHKEEVVSRTPIATTGLLSFIGGPWPNAVASEVGTWLSPLVGLRLSSYARSETFVHLFPVL